MRPIVFLVPVLLLACSPALQLPDNLTTDPSFHPPGTVLDTPDEWGELVAEVDPFPWYGSADGPGSWSWLSDPLEVIPGSSSLVVVSGAWPGALSAEVLDDAPPVDPGGWSARFVHAGDETVAVYLSGSIPDASLAMFEPGDVWPTQGTTTHTTIGSGDGSVRLTALSSGATYGDPPIAEAEFPAWAGLATTYILTGGDVPTWVATDDDLAVADDLAVVRVAWMVDGTPDGSLVDVLLGAPWIGVGGTGEALQGSTQGPWYVNPGTVRIGVR